MQVAGLILPKFLPTDDDKAKVEKLVTALYTNTNVTIKILKAIDFIDNIDINKNIKTIEVIHNTINIVNHHLDKTVSCYLPINDNRIERVIVQTSNSKSAELIIFLKSTTVKTTGVAGDTVIVLNPYIFNKGDNIQIGTVKHVIKAIDFATQVVTLVAAHTGVTANDTVQLISETAKLLIC